MYCYYPVAISYQYYKAFTFSHSTCTVIQCYFAIEMATKLQCYYIICVLCTALTLCSYIPASNPLWGGVLFLCKRVAAFPFVGIRITHLNTLPFDRTRDGLTSKYSTVRTCVGPRLSKLSYCNDCIWAIYD